MPIYTYYNHEQDGTHERNVSVEQRDNQYCETCGDLIDRVLDFNGLVWAPSAGGMR